MFAMRGREGDKAPRCLLQSTPAARVTMTEVNEPFSELRVNGTQLLLVDDNRYLYKRFRTAKTKSTWRCIKANTEQTCPSTIVVQAGRVVWREAAHNHLANEQELEAKVVHSAMWKASIESTVCIKMVVETQFARLPQAVLQYLPEPNRLVSSLMRSRKRVQAQVAPAEANKEPEAPVEPETPVEPEVPVEPESPEVPKSEPRKRKATLPKDEHHDDEEEDQQENQHEEDDEEEKERKSLILDAGRTPFAAAFTQVFLPDPLKLEPDVRHEMSPEPRKIKIKEDEEFAPPPVKKVRFMPNVESDYEDY